jgi:hypothetical protein
MWTNGFQGAIQKADALAKQGWVVDTDRGALTTKQAEAMAKEAEKKGFETQLLPIAQLDGGVAQFVATKPKLVDPASSSPTAATSAGSLTADQIEGNFLREFWSPAEQPTEMDNGYTLNPATTMGFARRDADPKSAKDLVAKGRRLLQDPKAAIREEFDREAVVAIYNAYKNMGKKFVAFGPTGQETAADAKNILKGIRALQGGREDTKIRIASEGKDGVVYLANPEGDMAILAPIVSDDPSTKDPNTISYNEAIAAVRKP